MIRPATRYTHMHSISIWISCEKLLLSIDRSYFRPEENFTRAQTIMPHPRLCGLAACTAYFSILFNSLFSRVCVIWLVHRQSTASGQMRSDVVDMWDVTRGTMEQKYHPNSNKLQFIRHLCFSRKMLNDESKTETEKRNMQRMNWLFLI